MVIFGDFILLNAIIFLVTEWYWRVDSWPERSLEIYILVNNIALMLSQMRFSTIVHLRLVGAGDVLQRLVGLTVLQSILAYILLRVFDYALPIGWLQYGVGTIFFIVLLFKRLLERWFVKLYREAGRNTRAVTLVGSDPELVGIFRKLKDDPTLGYRMEGYYGDDHLQKLVDELYELENDKGRELIRIKRLGSYEDLMMTIEKDEDLYLGDELYLCISRKRRDDIRKISKYCDHHMVRFYYVPVSVETIGLNLKREMLDDIEIFTTYENPLQNSVNRFIIFLYY